MLKNNMYANIMCGLIEIAIGAITAFLDPSALLTFIFFVLGGLIIAFGVLTLLTYPQAIDEKNKTEILVIGIISIIIGIIVISYPHSAACFIAGGALIAFPIYRIVISSNKLETLKKEWLKLALGAIMVLFGVGMMVQVVLYVVGGLLMLLGVLNLLYALCLYVRFKKEEKYNKENNDVIDV